MKTFKILFSVVVIGLMALQPMQSSFAEADCTMEKPEQIGDWLVTGKARKIKFKQECRTDCDRNCYLQKRDNPDITISFE